MSLLISSFRSRILQAATHSIISQDNTQIMLLLLVAVLLLSPAALPTCAPQGLRSESP
jgi:hypothetical protein